jgi:hypothetical protein
LNLAGHDRRRERSQGRRPDLNGDEAASQRLGKEYWASLQREEKTLRGTGRADLGFLSTNNRLSLGNRAHVGFVCIFIFEDGKPPSVISRDSESALACWRKEILRQPQSEDIQTQPDSLVA